MQHRRNVFYNVYFTFVPSIRPFAKSVALSRRFEYLSVRRRDKSQTVLLDAGPPYTRVRTERTQRERFGCRAYVRPTLDVITTFESDDKSKIFFFNTRLVLFFFF